METLEKMPDGYVSFLEIVRLSELSKNTVRHRLKIADVPGRLVHITGTKDGGVRIYPLREALYAVLDK